MKITQKTINKSCQIEGVSLHRGLPVKAVFHPAEVDAGIVFKVVSKSGEEEFIPVASGNLCNRELRSAMTNGKAVVETVEHVLSAVEGLGIHNLIIELNEIEPPACDGSAFKFCEVLQKTGIREQEKEIEVYVVKEPLTVYDKEGSYITVLPNKDGLKVTYTLDGDALPRQNIEYEHSTESYIETVSRARTFCRSFEVEFLKATSNVGEGANEENTLVVDLNTVDEKQKFPNELAYHKVLDLIGDLSFLGQPLHAHLICHKSGHSCNHKLVKELVKRKQDCVFNINRIKEILPHAYPFLLVDKILEYEENRRVVGLKNVTYNEQFFQGHFPQEPIMPGVLLIEALAQTGAVFLYKNQTNKDKLVLFSGVDKVKFRRQVVPGDQVILEVVAKNIKPSMGIVKATASVNGSLACEAELKFMTVTK